MRSRPGGSNFEGMGSGSRIGGGVFEVFMFVVQCLGLCDGVVDDGV